MIDLASALQARIQAYQDGTLADKLKQDGKDYNKRWAFAVQCFQKRVNRDRKRSGMPELSFIAIRQKLIAVTEISDLRWFYRECEKYAMRGRIEKDREKTFSRCFFGALKVK